MTTRVDYRGELKRHRDQLAALLAEREEVEIKIARLKKKVAAFAELSDESEFAEQAIDLDLGGLTDVCRTAMRASRKEWMTIADIQKIVEELGFPLDQYKAPAASITTTVNRLADGKEIEANRDGDSVRYKWIGTNRFTLADLLGREDGIRKLAEGARFPRRQAAPREAPGMSTEEIIKLAKQGSQK